MRRARLGIVMPEIRQARPQDYDSIVAVTNEWWGRDVAPGLPRLFLDHFWSTSLCAERAHDRRLVGFLVGFHSPSQPTEAYIHYVGVDPAERRSGIARCMYDQFANRAVSDERKSLRAITSAGNQQSIDFHRRMGFQVTGR